MRACDAAVEILRETDNPAVMWGDTGLLHLIAKRAGMASQNRAWKTEQRVLQALTRQPGLLIPAITFGHRKRRVRIFHLPENLRVKKS